MMSEAAGAPTDSVGPVDQSVTEPGGEHAVEVPADARWFVVNTYSGYESKVKKNLEQRIRSMEASDKIFDVVVPIEEIEESRHGQRRKVERKMYPGYVLVRMVFGDDSWMVVRNTPGVVNFVGSGNRPTPLPPEEASTIFRQMEGDAPRPEVRLQVEAHHLPSV